MARLNIEDSLWADPRFQDLMIAVGSRYMAKGIVIELWTMAQKFWLASGGRGIPKPAWEAAGMPPELLQCKLAKDNGDFIYAAGSKEQFSWLNQKSESGKAGGKASGISRRETKGKSAKQNEAGQSGAKRLEPSYSSSYSLSSSFSNSDSNSNIAQGFENEAPARAVVNPDGEAPGALTWRGYKKAYGERYGEPPAWNAKTAGMLKQFVARVPASEAPSIAAFYVGHNDRFYVQAMHPPSLLLRDAEKLRTEWATGRRMTSAKAKNSETEDYANDQLRRIAEGSL